MNDYSSRDLELLDDPRPASVLSLPEVKPLPCTLRCRCSVGSFPRLVCQRAQRPTAQRLARLIPVMEQKLTAISMLAQPDQHNGRGQEYRADEVHLVSFLAKVLQDAKTIAPQPARRGAGSETPQALVKVCHHIDFTAINQDNSQVLGSPIP